MNWDFAQIASSLKCQNPTKNQLFTAFKSLDYEVTQTYYNPKLYKTNAPPDVVYDVFKAYVIKMILAITFIIENPRNWWRLSEAS